MCREDKKRLRRLRTIDNFEGTLGNKGLWNTLTSLETDGGRAGDENAAAT